uniref:Putative secreted protein n=2 Tax=Ixodes ricinus TaxID=34613 RepID=V5HG67_IXORI
MLNPISFVVFLRIPGFVFAADLEAGRCTLPSFTTYTGDNVLLKCKHTCRNGATTLRDGGMCLVLNGTKPLGYGRCEDGVCGFIPENQTDECILGSYYYFNSSLEGVIGECKSICLSGRRPLRPDGEPCVVRFNRNMTFINDTRIAEVGYCHNGTCVRSRRPTPPYPTPTTPPVSRCNKHDVYISESIMIAKTCKNSCPPGIEEYRPLGTECVIWSRNWRNGLWFIQRFFIGKCSKGTCTRSSTFYLRTTRRF